MGLKTLILASQSPRRRSLLAESGRAFCVIPAEGVAEESPRESDQPAALAVRNALAKARAVSRSAEALKLAPAAVIGCDTIACVPVPERSGAYEILVSPYLSNEAFTGNSKTAYSLIADPNRVPAFEIAFLGGQDRPTVQQADASFDTLGVVFRGYLDFGVKEQDYRGILKVAGNA